MLNCLSLGHVGSLMFSKRLAYYGPPTDPRYSPLSPDGARFEGGMRSEHESERWGSRGRVNPSGVQNFVRRLVSRFGLGNVLVFWFILLFKSLHFLFWVNDTNSIHCCHCVKEKSFSQYLLQYS